MELSSEHTGKRSKPFEVEVTRRRSMNYAAGLNDPNPCYFDEERPGGVVAPPMLAVALTWPLSERFAEFWEHGDFPLEVLARQVHYSEYIEWERPMRPNDRLRIEGEVVAIAPHRAGTYLVIRYDAHDKKGAPVFHEYIGALLRGVACTDEGQGADSLPEITRRKTTEGPVWEKVAPVDPLAAHIYDGCADIHFPIHTSAAFAHSVGLPGILYQGTATLSLAVREITNLEAEGDPARVRQTSCLFTGMVFPGSDITIRALAREETDEMKHIYFCVLNADGKPALRSGCVALAR